jgi:hypothetical protein
MKRGIKNTGEISEWRFATQATHRQFSKKFMSEDNLPEEIKLCPFSSTLGAKTPFLQKNGGCTMGKTEKRAIVGEGCAENDKR